MLTEEQYNKVNGYREILEHFKAHQTYVGGADGLFDYLEQQGIALEPIIRTCNECKSGFLLFSLSLLKQYEKTNLNTSSTDSL